MCYVTYIHTHAAGKKVDYSVLPCALFTLPCSHLFFGRVLARFCLLAAARPPPFFCFFCFLFLGRTNSSLSRLTLFFFIIQRGYVHAIRYLSCVGSRVCFGLGGEGARWRGLGCVIWVREGLVWGGEGLGAGWGGEGLGRNVKFGELWGGGGVLRVL